MYYIQVWNRYVDPAQLCIHGRDILTLLKYAQRLGLHATVVKGVYGLGPLYLLDDRGCLLKLT